MPQITLITITYNSAETIASTLDSVAGQSFRDFEYILVDGASSDNTVQIVRDHQVTVDKLISERDNGLYDALNKGISFATGDYLGFLHSDDVFANQKVLEKLSEKIVGGVGACYGDIEYVSSENPDRVIRHWRSGEISRNKLRNGWMPPHPTFYMRRDFYAELGVYDASLQISADYDAMLRYLYTNNVSAAYLPEVMVKMKVGGASNRSLTALAKKMREDVITMKNHGLFWPRALIVKNISKLPQFFARS